MQQIWRENINSKNEPIKFVVGTVTNQSNAKDKLTNQNQNISMDSKIFKKKIQWVTHQMPKRK